MDEAKSSSERESVASSHHDISDDPDKVERDAGLISQDPGAEHEEKDPSTSKAPSLLRTISRKSASSWKDPGPPPDGGVVAWTQVGMGFLFICSTWGYVASFGVFQTYYTSALDRSPSDISWIGAMQIFLLFFIGTFSGRALDAGLFRPIFGAGLVFQLVGSFTTSFCTEYWQILLAQGLCTGIGNGLAFCPCMALVSTYFSKHKTMALTITASGSAFGGMFFPAIVSQLLPKIGFGWVVRIIAFIQLVFDLLAFAFMKTRMPPRRSGPIIEFAAFKEFTYSVFCLGMFFNFWALYFAFFYVGSFARDQIGLHYSDSVNLLITLNGVGLIGRLVPAWYADASTGPLNLLIPLSFASGIIVYSWSAVDSIPGLYVFTIMYGVFINGIQGLFPATLSSLTEDLSKAGVRMGMCFTIVSIACLTGSPLGGALITAGDGNYLYAQMWAGTSLVVGALALLAARIKKTGWVFKVKI